MDKTAGNLPIFTTDNSTSVYGGITLQMIDGIVYAGYGDGIAAGTGNRITIQSSTTLTAAKWYH